MELEQLIVPLLLDPAKYLSGIQKATQEADSLQNKLANFGGNLVVGGIGLAGAGIAALTGFLGVSTAAASDAEDIQADLNATLKSTKGVAGMTADAINDLATSLGNTTKFEDDAIVKGEGMLLTFTNIGKNVFPMATEAMLNMSQKMGTDLQGSAIQLGKALNDPTNGVTALTRVGVTFTDKQKKLIETLQKSGNIEAAQTIILKELETEFGGVAKAAGETASGKLTIFKNKLGNLQETIGGAVLPVISDLATKMSDWLDNPAVQQGITNITTGVALFATNAISYIPQVISGIQSFVDFLANNQPLIIGIFAGLGSAIAVWAWTSAVAMAGVIGPMLPVIAVVVGIGAAVAGLAYLWKNNWGDIQGKTAAFWGWLQPILQNLSNWLQVNIPIAIAWLTDKWDNVLLPAITRFWSWTQANVFPLFVTLFNWLKVTIPEGIATLSDFWENTLLPKMTLVYDWIQVNLMPLFNSLVNFMGAEFNLALTNLSKLWAETLLPKIKEVGGYINETLLPAFKTFTDWIDKNIGPVFERVGKIITDTFGKALHGIEDSIRWIRNQLDTLAGSANAANSGISQGTGGYYDSHGVWVPKRASGGPVEAGRAYIVGEVGPEMFVPQTSGRIIPNNELGKGGITNNYYVSPHYYKGDEPTLLDELTTLSAFA